MPIRFHVWIILVCVLALISGCGPKVEPPEVDEGPFTPASISIRENGALMELRDEKLVFIDSAGTEWVAPRGTLTDGASIPRLALPITDGRWDRDFLKAAVVHDAYCQVENETRTPEQYRKRTWQAVHKMFYEACVAGGTAPMLAKVMFAAVWLAGPRWNDPERDLQQVSSDMLTRGFTGSKDWIEQNDPTVDEIVADMNRREPLLVNLSKLETGITTAFENRDMRAANALLREQDTILKRELDRSPGDLMLLSFKGFWHTNQAVYYRRSNIEDKAIDELLNSERMFNAVIDKAPRDPGALTGLGGVSIQRRELILGGDNVRRALDVSSESETAERDLQRIEAPRERPPPD